MNIPYTIVGGVRFYDRKEIRDIISYMRLVLNPADWGSFGRIVNAPARGIGKTSLEKIRTAGSGDLSPEEAVQAALKSGAVKGKAARGAGDLLEALVMLRNKLSLGTPLDEFVVAVLDETGYLRALQDQATDEARNRVETWWWMIFFPVNSPVRWIRLRSWQRSWTRSPWSRISMILKMRVPRSR
jgi:DNA helicase-2/ATP-dependent DNA helicase PcrA